jgi:hypothetical protein
MQELGDFVSGAEAAQWHQRLQECLLTLRGRPMSRGAPCPDETADTGRSIPNALHTEWLHTDPEDRLTARDRSPDALTAQSGDPRAFPAPHLPPIPAPHRRL